MPSHMMGLVIRFRAAIMGISVSSGWKDTAHLVRLDFILVAIYPEFH